MKIAAIAVAALLLIFMVAAQAQKPAPTQAGSVEQELIKLENGWNDAWVKKDAAFLEKILADEIIETDYEGVITTKAQDLANLKSKDYVATSLVADDMKVRVYGNAAVVTGRNTSKMITKGKDTSGQYRWTDTWVLRDGRWQCVATHSSKVVQK